MNQYYPSKKSQVEQELISIESMRNRMGSLVEGKTDKEMEDLRDKFYGLAYFLYHDWRDSLK